MTIARYAWHKYSLKHSMTVSSRAQLFFYGSFVRSLFLFNSEMKSWDRFAIFMPFAIFMFAFFSHKFFWKIAKLALLKRCVDIDSRKLYLKCSLLCSNTSLYRYEKTRFILLDCSVTYILPVEMLLLSSFVINHRFKYIYISIGIEYHTQTLYKCYFSMKRDFFLLNVRMPVFEWWMLMVIRWYTICIDIDNKFIERIDNFDLLLVV